MAAVDQRGTRLKSRETSQQAIAIIQTGVLNPVAVDQGGSNQGTLKMEEPREFPQGLDVWFERRSKMALRFGEVGEGEQLQNEVVLFRY